MALCQQQTLSTDICSSCTISTSARSQFLLPTHAGTLNRRLRTAEIPSLLLCRQRQHSARDVDGHVWRAARLSHRPQLGHTNLRHRLRILLGHCHGCMCVHCCTPEAKYPHKLNSLSWDALAEMLSSIGCQLQFLYHDGTSAASLSRAIQAAVGARHHPPLQQFLLSEWSEWTGAVCFRELMLLLVMSAAAAAAPVMSAGSRQKGLPLQGCCRRGAGQIAVRAVQAASMISLIRTQVYLVAVLQCLNSFGAAQTLPTSLPF
jgi:hypothetical protein